MTTETELGLLPALAINKKTVVSIILINHHILIINCSVIRGEWNIN